MSAQALSGHSEAKGAHVRFGGIVLQNYFCDQIALAGTRTVQFDLEGYRFRTTLNQNS
jgi:hypothetical protein